MKTNLSIFIDGWCPNCRRFARLIKKIDLFNQLEKKDIRLIDNTESNLDIPLAKKFMASIDTNNIISYGYSSIYKIFRTLPVLWIFYPLMFVLYATNLGDVLYNELAIKRKIIPLNCDENSCEIN